MAHHMNHPPQNTLMNSMIKDILKEMLAIPKDHAKPEFIELSLNLFITCLGATWILSITRVHRSLSVQVGGHLKYHRISLPPHFTNYRMRLERPVFLTLVQYPSHSHSNAVRKKNSSSTKIMCISKRFSSFLLSEFIWKTLASFLKSCFFFFIYRIRDFALIIQMYKNKRNVMDFMKIFRINLLD